MHIFHVFWRSKDTFPFDIYFSGFFNKFLTEKFSTTESWKQFSRTINFRTFQRVWRLLQSLVHTNQLESLHLSSVRQGERAPRTRRVRETDSLPRNILNSICWLTRKWARDRDIIREALPLSVVFDRNCALTCYICRGKNRCKQYFFRYIIVIIRCFQYFFDRILPLCNLLFSFVTWINYSASASNYCCLLLHLYQRNERIIWWKMRK